MVKINIQLYHQSFLIDCRKLNILLFRWGAEKSRSPNVWLRSVLGQGSDFEDRFIFCKSTAGRNLNRSSLSSACRTGKLPELDPVTALDPLCSEDSESEQQTDWERLSMRSSRWQWYRKLYSCSSRVIPNMLPVQAILMQALTKARKLIPSEMLAHQHI